MPLLPSLPSASSHPLRRFVASSLRRFLTLTCCRRAMISSCSATDKSQKVSLYPACRRDPDHPRGLLPGSGLRMPQGCAVHTLTARGAAI